MLCVGSTVPTSGFQPDPTEGRPKCPGCDAPDGTHHFLLACPANEKQRGVLRQSAESRHNEEQKARRDRAKALGQPVPQLRKWRGLRRSVLVDDVRGSLKFIDSQLLWYDTVARREPCPRVDGG